MANKRLDLSEQCKDSIQYAANKLEGINSCSCYITL